MYSLIAATGFMRRSFWRQREEFIEQQCLHRPSTRPGIVGRRADQKAKLQSIASRFLENLMEMVELGMWMQLEFASKILRPHMQPQLFPFHPDAHRLHPHITLEAELPLNPRDGGLRRNMKRSMCGKWRPLARAHLRVAPLLPCGMLETSTSRQCVGANSQKGRSTASGTLGTIHLREAARPAPSTT